MSAKVNDCLSPEDNVIVVENVKALKLAVHEEMESIGCGFYQRRTVFILGFGNVADAVEVLAMGYILTVYETTEGSLTSWQSSFLAAAVFMGMFAGGFLGGVFGDIYGRKPVLLLTLSINASAAFLSAFSPSTTWLIIFRTIAGVGVGGVVSSLFALCVEHIPFSARGRYVTILCSFWMVGSVLTAATAWLMLGNNSNGDRIIDISWRWFAAAVGLPSFTCCLLTIFYIPESPHFLASKGKVNEVSNVINCMRTCNMSKSNDRTENLKLVTFEMTNSLESNDKSDSSHITSSSAFRRLFFPPQLRNTILLMICAFSLSFGSYGLSTWITKLFLMVGLQNPFVNALMFAGASLPGNIISLWLIDILGRKLLLTIAYCAAAVCALLFAFNVEGSTTVVVAVSCLFNACTTAAWNAFGVLSTENFPLEARTTGISIVNCCGRIGAITAQFVNGFLVGPPPHLTALLLTVCSVMLTGGISTQLINNTSSNVSSTIEHKPIKNMDDDMTTSVDDDQSTVRSSLSVVTISPHVLDPIELVEDTESEERNCLRNTNQSSTKKYPK